MRKYRTLLRRLWRNTPPERVPIRVTWIDGETIYINGDKADYDDAAAKGDKDSDPTKPTRPTPDGKPSSYNGDR